MQKSNKKCEKCVKNVEILKIGKILTYILKFNKIIIVFLKKIRKRITKNISVDTQKRSFLYKWFHALFSGVQFTIDDDITMFQVFPDFTGTSLNAMGNACDQVIIYGKVSNDVAAENNDVEVYGRRDSRCRKKSFQVESIYREIAGKNFIYVILSSGISSIAVTFGHERILEEMESVYLLMNQAEEIPEENMFDIHEENKENEAYGEESEIESEEADTQENIYDVTREAYVKAQQADGNLVHINSYEEYEQKDYLAIVPYYSGKIGYIVEYEE